MKYLLLIVLIPGMLLLYTNYPQQKMPANTVINKIVVLKSERKLLAYAGGQVIATYKIALGKAPVGAKKYEGDNKTPEGLYTINAKTSESRFHKNLAISYPNGPDLDSARAMGKDAGGSIKIHGLQTGLGFMGRLHTLADWTAGCIALTNEQMDNLYAHTPVGIPVEIKP